METFKISIEYDGKLRRLYHKTCKCGNEIWSPKHILNRRKFCSKKCVERKNKLLYTNLICSLCNKPFKRLTNCLKGSKHKIYFCSRSCKDKGQRLESGIEGIQPDHYGTAASKYRDKVNISNCISCGCNFLPLLIVHHIDGDRENNCVENLEVVCPNCHALRHMYKDGEKWVFSYRHLTPRKLLSGPWDCIEWSVHLQ